MEGHKEKKVIKKEEASAVEDEHRDLVIGLLGVLEVPCAGWCWAMQEVSFARQLSLHRPTVPQSVKGEVLPDH